MGQGARGGSNKWSGYQVLDMRWSWFSVRCREEREKEREREGEGRRGEG